MSEKNYEKYTFWKLINKYEIEIPIIQRDYAQGREDERTKQVRTNFISVLHEMIKDDKKSTDLDFIYGTVEKKNKFIPLDGQQRLTTLFLIHWYIAVKETKILENKDIFNRFSYKTRTSSKDFCNALTKNEVSISEEKSVSEVIEDCNWFYLSWKKDPTVKSMLVMLDTIHEKFKGKDDLWSKLIPENKEKDPITFQFLEITNFGLSDDLYIKMNSRGKQLTDYENFKAWLEEHVSKEHEGKTKISDSIIFDNWETSFDSVWADLFWKYKDENNFLVDEEFMRFFNGMALFKYIEQNENQEKNVDLKNTITEFTAKKSNDEIYIPLQRYKELECFDEVSLNNCFIVLESLKDGGNNNITKILGKDESSKQEKISFFIKENSLFEAFITGEITYNDRLLFYALSQFLINNFNEIYNNGFDLKLNDNHKENLKSWMRVMRNLILNSNINTPEKFADTIISIKKLAENCNNIYDFISKEKNKIENFLDDQVKEERIKAGLILNNKDINWEEKLLVAENHSYFEGQIQFILDICENNMKKFEEYSQKLSNIFQIDKNGRDIGFTSEEKKCLFQRALLAKSDYFRIDRDIYYCFAADRYEWRKLFFKDLKCQSAIKELLENNLSNQEVGIKNQLDKIIENNEENNEENKLWKKYLIKYPEIFIVSNKKRIKYKSKNDIKIILSNYDQRSTQNELFSYVFFLKYLKGKENNFTPFTTSWYYSEAGKNSSPCAVIGNWHYKESNFAIDIRFMPNRDENKYELKFFDKNKKEIQQEVKACLAGFNEKDNFFYKYFNTEKELEFGINELCNGFINIK